GFCNGIAHALRRNYVQALHELKPNERPMKPRVKVEMERVKLTLVALLPTLFLLASGQSVQGVCVRCVKPDAGSAICEGGKQSAPPLTSTEFSARTAHVRLGKYQGQGNLPPVEPFSELRSVEPPSRIFPALQARTMALAVSWQFACRTALS